MRYGAGDEVRTRDPQLGRLMLYQLSYTRYMVVGEGFEPSKVTPADLQSAPFDHSGTPPSGFQFLIFNHLPFLSETGAGDGTRTRNPLITNQVLYQLSYASSTSNQPQLLKHASKFPLISAISSKSQDFFTLVPQPSVRNRAL